MISYDTPNGRFNFRVAAVILYQGRVLVHRGEAEEFWTLPGGRCELHEHTRRTLQREMKEELDIDVEVDRLLWMVENFFEYDGRSYHELGFYYLVPILSDSPLLTRGDTFTGIDAGVTLLFEWQRLDELSDIVLLPSFLSSGLRELPESIQHLVHVDE